LIKASNSIKTQKLKIDLFIACKNSV